MSALDADPSLPPRACIPWMYSQPPVRATACEVSSVFADGTSQRARYDADSRPLEVRTHAAGGALSKVETHIWKDGLEQRFRTDYASGAFDQTEWTYDGQRRLLRRVMTGSSLPGPRSVDFTYDAQGRISQVSLSSNNTLLLTSTYSYDAAGRLVSISNPDTCGSNENRCATLSYWPHGELKRHAWTEGRYEDFVDEYDESGRLIVSTVARTQAGSRTTRTYDAAGRLIRLMRTASSFTVPEYDALTTTFYDPAGLRERFAEDQTALDPCTRGVCGPDIRTHRRVTRRTTFFCGTSIIALDEWDSDEDGVVDAQRTHERDVTGRLVHERYSGTPGLDEGPVRRDFLYDCSP